MAIERGSFDARLPVHEAVVEVDDLEALRAEERTRLAGVLNRLGFVLLRPRAHAERAPYVAAMAALFGETAPHDRAEPDGVVRIEPLAGAAGYLGASHEPHPVHTDGAFLAEPERVMTLRCEQPSETGGLSLLASGVGALEALRARPDDLRALAEPVLTVSRGGLATTGPVFERAGARTRLRFRADATARSSVRADAAQAYARLVARFSDPENQFTTRLERGDVLVADNAAVVHGRTGFPAGQPRRLTRVNFDGRGALAPRLAQGLPHLDEFLPAVGGADGGVPVPVQGAARKLELS